MINIIYKIVAVVLLLITSQLSYTQCPTCIPDTTCIPEIIEPSVCPEFMPNATSGEYYEEGLTFYLPTNFDDPGTGQNVTLNQVIITSATGLPFGIDFTTNNENLTYYPVEGENFGCATVCGTPILAGVYDVSITAHVFVEVLGFELEVDRVFISTLIVEQGESGNNSFIADVTTGCGEVESNFEALINTSSQVVEWDWNFGNGNFSDEQYPPVQVYSDPGNYTVSLTTELSNFTLTEVILSNVGGNWYGDIEEPLEIFASPDPYFIVKDSLNNVVFSSEVVENVFENTWTDIGLILNNPPYSIEFYDDDNISENDFLAFFTIEVAVGNQYYNDGDTNGSLIISLESESIFLDEEEIQVFPIPTFEFVVNEDNNTITVEADETVTDFVWSINGEIQPTVTPTINMYFGGVYSCAIANTYGCIVYSEEYIHCPEFTVEYDEGTDLIEAPEGFETYQWYFNNVLMDGETNFFVEDPEFGDYYVEFSTDYGCSTQSEVFVYELDETAIKEVNQDSDVLVYPNPITNETKVVLDAHFNTMTIYSFDGKVVSNISVEGKEVVLVDFKAFPSGIYFISLNNDKSTVVKRVVKL